MNTTETAVLWFIWVFVIVLLYNNLQMTNTVVSDAARYICHAENKAGIAEKLYDVEINGEYSMQEVTWHL